MTHEDVLAAFERYDADPRPPGVRPWPVVQAANGRESRFSPILRGLYEQLSFLWGHGYALRGTEWDRSYETITWQHADGRVIDVGLANGYAVALTRLADDGSLPPFSEDTWRRAEQALPAEVVAALPPLSVDYPDEPVEAGIPRAAAWVRAVVEHL